MRHNIDRYAFTLQFCLLDNLLLKHGTIQFSGHDFDYLLWMRVPSKVDISYRIFARNKLFNENHCTLLLFFYIVQFVSLLQYTIYYYKHWNDNFLFLPCDAIIHRGIIVSVYNYLKKYNCDFMASFTSKLSQG